MDLAWLPALASVAAAAVVILGVGAALGDGGGAVRWAGTWLLALTVVGGLIFLALGEMTVLWSEDPGRAQLVSLVVLGGALLLAMARMLAVDRTRHVTSDDDTDARDDDGGLPRGGPSAPPPLPPERDRPPEGPDWSDFDDLRRDWERVPAGVDGQ